ncbi:hypothetical protein B0H19DRAFT_1242754 [Mycena capillaripes]|nr:hypothetical protein B0H19DRAFT_1242754 [Mycena capillaripes]
MVFYTLNILEHTDRPVPGTISSLVFKIPAPENISALFITRYKELRRERKLEEEGHYDEDSGRLALQAYYDASVNVARNRWIERAKSVFTALVKENKKTIRHVELVLPTGGFATPVDLFGTLEDIEHLESFSIQWSLTALLIPDWAQILDDTIIPAFTKFRAALTAFLAMHAETLKRLRVSLPQSTPRKPFSALSINAETFPALPQLEILDLTHWGPRISDILNLLQRAPNLQHLIVDHGVEIDLSNEGGESWAGLGNYLSAQKDTLHLRSISAALHDVEPEFAPFGYRLDLSDLREAVRGNLSDVSALDDLILCTAWPREYSLEEPGLTDAEEEEKDLFSHAPGCGHLAYPPERRPTPGLWPAQGNDSLAMETMRGKPWY